MKKIIYSLLITFLFSAFQSCKKKIQSEKGGIDIISNVYFNASSGLDKMQSFQVSRMNYSRDTIIEIVPDLNIPELNAGAFFIKDSTCYNLGENFKSVLFSEMKKKSKPQLVYKKTIGAIFSKDKIPNYSNRKNLSDTVLFKKPYKRFEINSPTSYTRYYVYPTDTILPYSIYKEVENDYNGRIERIDSYNKKKDIFVSMQLLTRNKWDKEAEELIKFNRYVNNRKK